MRTHTLKLGAVGATLGLVLISAAVSPAFAAKPVRATSSYTCASFQGKTATGTPVSFSGVSLKAGEKITAKVSPATADDVIFMPSGVMGFSTQPALSGYTYQAPADGVYALTWGVYDNVDDSTPSTANWSFTASCDTGTATSSPVKGRGKK